VHPLDTYRAAGLLVDWHGDEAPGEARLRAISLRQDGDEQESFGSLCHGPMVS